MTNKNNNLQNRWNRRTIAAILSVWSCCCLLGCQNLSTSNSVTLEQSLPVTLRDMDDEYAAAKRANLGFYSPRFFKNAEKAYQTIAQLRKNEQQAGLISNHLAIFKHNLSRAYSTKNLVQQRMGKLLVRYLRLENQPIYEKYPDKFKDLDKLMNNCLNLLELRQIDSLSWDKLQADKFDDMREQFQQGLDQLEKLP